MSTIVKTDAIVLRASRYRESSKIVTFFTRRYGKLTAMAKGALRAKSGYGSSLEPMSYSSIVLYLRESRDIQTLTACDLRRPFRRVSEDLEKMACGMKMIELMNRLSEPHHEHPELFTLLLSSLERLDDATKNPGNSLYTFETRLAGMLGYGIDF
jgi:DNA repair protein RecO (recombination protein O)